MTEENSAGLIIAYNETSTKKNKYLLLKYKVHNQKHWDFVKGTIEKGESIKETALREALEETGIPQKNINMIEGFAEMITYYYTRKDVGLVKKKVTYLLGIVDKKIIDKVRISEEHEEYKWVDKEEALEMIKFSKTKKVIREAEKKMNNILKLKE